jgi:hypothetical protein
MQTLICPCIQLEARMSHTTRPVLAVSMIDSTAFECKVTGTSVNQTVRGFTLPRVAPTAELGNVQTEKLKSILDLHGQEH